MGKKRNSVLFPQDSTSFLVPSTTLQPEVQSNLFGVSEPEVQTRPESSKGSSTIANHGKKSIPVRPVPSHAPVSVIDSLGGNLHQLKSSQIDRLVSVKYHGDPNLLIKQLSIDLARKESELILLRQEKFTNEQKLIKLCNEYGNLSTLEIHQKLNETHETPQQSPGIETKNTPEENDVNGALKDLIDGAINDKMRLSDPRTSLRRSVSSQSRFPETIDESTFAAKAIKRSITPTIPSRSLSSSKHTEPNSIYKQSNRSWLSGWFNSSEDLPSSNLHSTVPQTSSSYTNLMSAPTKNTRPHSRVFPSNFMNIKTHEEPSRKQNKEPVEMEDIHSRIDKANIKAEGINYGNHNADDIHIDKYGFFTDIGNIKGKSPVKGENESESSSERIASEIRSRDSSFSQNIKAQGSLGAPPTTPLLSQGAYSNTPPNSLITSPVNAVASPGITHQTVIASSQNVESRSRSDSSHGILIGNKDKLQTIDQLKEIGKIHDSINLQLEHQWEALFREMEKDFFTYTKDEGEDIGLDAMIGMNGLNLIKLDNWNDRRRLSNLHRKTNYYDRLVDLINQFGIAPKYRMKLWLQLSGAKNLRVNGQYQEILNEVNNYVEKSENSNDSEGRSKTIIHNIKQIDLDLHRTLPSNYYFNNLIELKPGPNYYKLQRILYAFVTYEPDIGYLQGMNKIVGNLLLLLSKGNDMSERFDEEDIFWIFIGLLEEILPKYPVGSTTTKSSLEWRQSETISEVTSTNDNAVRTPEHSSIKFQSFYNSLLSIRIDQIIMKNVYFEQLLPNLHAHFKNIGFEIELITMNWWLTLFIDLRFLDMDTWFKVFDNLLIGETIDDVDSGELFLPDDMQTHGSRDNADSSKSQSVAEIQRAIKLISLTLAMLKCLETLLIGIRNKDTIYEFLNSNNSSKMYENDTNLTTSVNIKFADLAKYNQMFTKKIKWTDLSRHRTNIF